MKRWRDHVGNRCVAFLAAFVLATEAIGHQDRLIKLAPDGQLLGFPPEYEPAALYLPNASGAERAVLRLRGQRLEFPECLSVLFAKASRPHMVLSASWYHDPKRLPYYLAIRLPITTPNAHGFYDGWSILVDITDVKVLKVQALFTIGDAAQRQQEIDVETFCSSGGVTSVIGTIR